MFRFPKHKDIITLYHKASSPSSMRVAALLKKQQTAAIEAGKPEFDLQISEEVAPTPTQVGTILDYLGNNRISSLFEGASNKEDALKVFSQSPDSFKRPTIVDWNNGKVVIGENESEILKMLNALAK
ncbi:thioredoxin-like protein [Podospora australis]|uniref:Thioredoxin-like protein n=1 Tax=Podospora australis TaxID=1536484 RepID=A0AAN6X2M4_9PEZI|nr:thioredoxin-like protein [Podospora australis]